MTTTQSDYQNVLQWLGLNGSRRELRTEPRVNVEAKLAVAHIDRTGSQTIVTVIARDLTPDGIGLFCDRPMKAGERLILSLDDAVPPLRIACEVRHCRALPDRRFHIGASFAEHELPEVNQLNARI